MKVAVNLEKTEVAEFYRKMLLIRRFEEASARLYMQRLIGGFLHLYIGEEAVAVGAISLLGPQDYVITHYRDHGHALARGMDPKACMAELCGRSTGTSGGKGGSMHLFDADLNFMEAMPSLEASFRSVLGLGWESRCRVRTPPSWSSLETAQ